MFGAKNAVVLLIPETGESTMSIRARGSLSFNGATERTGTDMMSDEIAMVTLSSAILFAVLMFAILMRKA